MDDNLDWRNELEESLIMSGTNGLLYNNNNKNIETISSKLDTYNHPSSQKTELFSNFWPQWNSSRSGAGSGWGVAVNAGTSRSCIDYGRPSALNTIAPLQNSLNILDTSNVGKNSNVVDHFHQQQTPMATNAASFESSLDCLLSASTDTTTTSADQDDGISLIFSDCKNLWNFAAAAKSIPSPSNINSQNSEEITISRRSPPSPNGSKRRRETTSTEPPIGLSKQRNFGFLSNYSTAAAGASEKPKKPRLDKQPISSSSNINFQQSSSSASSGGDEPDAEAIAQMKEIIYRAAAFRPVNFGVEPAEKPRRKNVRVSNDPQTVAARQRRERISERIRVLQKLVPGGSKMDTASMLDEAANYLKFLRSQVKALEAFGHKGIDPTVHSFPANTNLAFSPFLNYSFAMQQPQFSIHNPNPVNQSKS